VRQPTMGKSQVDKLKADVKAYLKAGDRDTAGFLTLAGKLQGKLAAVASKSNGAWQVTLFSYDSDGRVATRYVYTEANGGASVLTAVNMRDSVFRYLNYAPVERWTTVVASTFNQCYEYDGR